MTWDLRTGPLAFHEMDRELWVCNPGTIEYGSALALQEQIRDAFARRIWCPT